MLKKGCGATLIARDQEGDGSLFHSLHWVPSVDRHGAGCWECTTINTSGHRHGPAFKTHEQRSAASNMLKGQGHFPKGGGPEPSKSAACLPLSLGSLHWRESRFADFKRKIRYLQKSTMPIILFFLGGCIPGF